MNAPQKRRNSLRPPIFDLLRIGNMYCGPFSVAVVLGIRYETAVDEFLKCRKNRPYKPVKGVYLHEIDTVLRRYRKIRIHNYPAVKRKQMTLARWIKTRTDAMYNRLYIVSIKSHVAVVYKDQFIDNNTLMPISTGSVPGKYQPIDTAYEIMGGLPK